MPVVTGKDFPEVLEGNVKSSLFKEHKDASWTEEDLRNRQRRVYLLEDQVSVIGLALACKKNSDVMWDEVVSWTSDNAVESNECSVTTSVDVT